MLLEGRDVHEVARLHLDHAIIELKPRRSPQHDHPLVLRLMLSGSISARSAAARMNRARSLPSSTRFPVDVCHMADSSGEAVSAWVVRHRERRGKGNPG